LSLLKLTDAAVSIVNVQENLDLSEIPSLSEQKTGKLFEKFKHSHHFLEAENVESALFDFAHLNASDLIVLSTRHYSIWQKIWHTSMTKKLALHSTIPVLILHEN
jgi:nucleotide-binding universal stress UspA family protein